MTENSVVGIILLILNLLVTFKGLQDRQYFEKYKFKIDPILRNKEYGRMFSSGFLHVGWLHFGFNMLALLSFATYLEWVFGYFILAGIYFGSKLGGSLLALYVHRNHGDYSAVGASGAVSGVIFSGIILDPTGSIGFAFIPLEFPAWLMGLIFVAVSIWGIKSPWGNIGHDAHLGGALTGALITMALKPHLVIENWWVILILVVPTLLFLILIIRNPKVLLVENYWGENIGTIKPLKRKKTKSQAQKSKEEKLNQILAKIQNRGKESLSPSEKKWLEDFRKNL